MPWPGAMDVQLMKALAAGPLRFEDFSVTNGFVTSHLRPEQLSQLEGAGE